MEPGRWTSTTPSAAFQTLVDAYRYWIADADIDGFRVDTVKHMDPGATRYFASAIHEFAQTIGKDSFFLVGEITGSREEAIRLRDLTGLDAALGLADVQGRMVDAVKGWGDPAGYFDLFRNSIQVDKATHTWFRNHVVTSLRRPRPGPPREKLQGTVRRRSGRPGPGARHPCPERHHARYPVHLLRQRAAIRREISAGGHSAAHGRLQGRPVHQGSDVRRPLRIVP